MTLRNVTRKAIVSVCALAVGVVVASSGSQEAFAATATSNLEVSATVANTCVIATAPVAFGNYDTVTGAAVASNGTVTVTCTAGASTAITLGQGLHVGGGSSDAVPVRQMLSGSSTDVLGYQLYSEPTLTTVWGNTVGTSVAHTGTGASADLTVYGRIAAGQTTVSAGTYTDTIIATVTF